MFFSFLAGLWQKSRVLCMLFCPDGPETSYDCFSNVDKKLYCHNVFTVRLSINCVNMEKILVRIKKKVHKRNKIKFIHSEKATKEPAAKNDTTENRGCFNQILSFES